MAKTLAAVLGCYILSVVLVLATDPLLSRLFPGDYALGHIPSDKALLASTGFFVLISILCAAICARVAREAADRAVLWFFALGEIMGLAATVPNWSKGWPHWYWISWLGTWPLACWIGLRLLGPPRPSPTRS